MILLDLIIEQADWTTGKSEGTYPSDSTWAASKTQIIPQQMDYRYSSSSINSCTKRGNC